jgi:hypothetical protein
MNYNELQFDCVYVTPDYIYETDNDDIMLLNRLESNEIDVEVLIKAHY